MGKARRLWLKQEKVLPIRRRISPITGYVQQLRGQVESLKKDLARTAKKEEDTKKV